MPSERKFYRTRFIVEVLSEEPIEGCELTDILRDCNEGDCVLYSNHSEQFQETGPIMAKLLEDCGSDAEFFQLTPEGEDKEE